MGWLKEWDAGNELPHSKLRHQKRKKGVCGYCKSAGC